MSSAKILAHTLAELRALALVPEIRRAEAAPLLARIVASCKTLWLEQRVHGIAFRLQAQPDGGASVLITCTVHHPAGTGALSATETAVAEQLCEGRTLAQIAQMRGVSANTVKSQVRQIFRKLNVESRVALVRKLCP